MMLFVTVLSMSASMSSPYLVRFTWAASTNARSKQEALHGNHGPVEGVIALFL